MSADVDREDEKTGRTQLAEDAHMQSLMAVQRANSVENKLQRSEKKMTWAMLVAGVGGVCASLVGGGWAARAYLSSKADAAPVEKLTERVTDAEKAIAVEQREHANDKALREAQAAQLNRVEGKVDRLDGKIDKVVERVVDSVIHRLK
jgi:hypothetical protein